LARDFNGSNPGQGRIRMALVAETAECLEAAERIARFVRAHPAKMDPGSSPG
jgi:N-succinyldiaminopimelate aminotransferase